jgi:hypothetical protein
MKKSQKFVNDISGKRFGRLVAQWPIIGLKNGSYKWLTVCDCGSLKITLNRSLNSGRSQSCGCLQRDRASAALSKNRQDRVTHGHASNYSHSKTYHTWHGMKTRCGNPKHKEYYCYGGAGVIICDRWLNSFENFLADMGERPEGTTLGRYGDVGNYQLDNCAWMTKAEQIEHKAIKRKVMRG